MKELKVSRWVSNIQRIFSLRCKGLAPSELKGTLGSKTFEDRNNRPFEQQVVQPGL